MLLPVSLRGSLLVHLKRLFRHPKSADQTLLHARLYVLVSDALERKLLLQVVTTFLVEAVHGSQR